MEREPEIWPLCRGTRCEVWVVVNEWAWRAAGNDTDVGKTKCWEINLFQCYLVHHTSHIYGPGIETGLLGEWLATNRPFRRPIVPFIHVSFWYGVLSVSCHRLNVWTTFIFAATRNLMFTSCRFLSAFAKLQKAAIRFDMSVLPSVCLPAYLSVYPSFCPSVRPSVWNNSAPTEDIFMIFCIWVLFENLLRKIQVSLKSCKNDGYITWRPMYIIDGISLSFS